MNCRHKHTVYGFTGIGFSDDGYHDALDSSVIGFLDAGFPDLHRG